MEVQTYRVSVSSFPRMDYAQRNRSDIYEKYIKLVRSFGIQECNPNSFDNVFVHICKNETEPKFSVAIADVVKQEDSSIAVETTRYESINTFLNQIPKHVNAVSVVLLDADFCKIISNTLNDDTCVLVFLSSAEISDVKSTSQIFSTKDCVMADVGNLLEKYVLKPMEGVCEFLCKLRSSVDDLMPEYRERAISRTVLDTEQKLDRGIDDLRPPEGETMQEKQQQITMYRKLMKEDDASSKRKSRAVKRTARFESGHTFSKKRFKFCTVKQLEEDALGNVGFLEQVDCDAVDRLLKSIRALYWMTNIPENQQPRLPAYQPKKLDEKICDSLSVLGGSLKGIGFKLDKLTIFLSQNVEKKREIEKKVGDIIKQFDVKHQIEYVSEEIEQLMYVGAKLEPVPGYGTLGCFATIDSDTRCILLSKHVAKCGKEMYFENKRKVCTILPATITEEWGDLDIAAAVIRPEESICSTEFKDSTGKQTKGKLYEYNGEDKIITETRKVHIWGASSKPGKGEIEMAEYKTGANGCLQPLIRVTDGDSVSRFAESGDSGAIVCVDHPDGNFVHAVGMLMGEGTSRSEDKRIYYALPLSNGLKQLERKTNKKFELC